MWNFAIVAALVACISLTSFAAGRDENLFANGDFSGGIAGWSVTQSEACSVAVVDANAGGAAKALALRVQPPPRSKPWSVSVRQSVDGFMDKGHRVVMKAWMRSAEGCKVLAFLEIAKDPYTKSISDIVELAPDWKEYSFAGTCLHDYSPGEASAGFHLGFKPGMIEIADVRLFDLDLDASVIGPRPTPDQPVSLIVNGDFAQSLDGNWYAAGENLRASMVPAEADRYKRAIRLDCSPAPEAKPWALQLGQACNAYVRRGDAVYFRAWLRSPDRCRVSFIYELAQEPHTKSISRTTRLTPEWKEYRFMGRALQGFRPAQSQAKFFLGHDKGTIEIAGVRVENFGDAEERLFDQTIDWWGGRAHPDTWRQAALERIERVRKRDLVVEVVDGAGRPVPGAQVRVQQRRHHFRFGTALPAARLVDTRNPDNLRFQREVERLFNTVTFENDLKWAAYSDYRLRTVGKAIQWLQARNIGIRGHCLLWGEYRHIPKPFKALRGAELLQACKAHVADYATRMRDKLYVWDVVNEARSNTALWEEIGWGKFADSFRWARTVDPNVLLCYNDYAIVNQPGPHRQQVAERIRYLFDQGAPVDVLGIQAHMSLPLTPLHRVLEVLDEWAAFGKDLEITEFDVMCQNDQVHAAYVRDFMIATFSHPKVTAFIMWGFWEGSHWRGKDGGAMIRRDWTSRPAQEAYEELVFTDWWTNWQGATNTAGQAKLRAFHGSHEIIAELNGKSVTSTVGLTPGSTASVKLALR